MEAPENPELPAVEQLVRSSSRLEGLVFKPLRLVVHFDWIARVVFC